MSVHAVIWDLGGVIVRTEDFDPRDKLAARLGVTRRELSELVFGHDGDYRAQLGEITAEQQWHAAADRLGLPHEEMPAFLEQFFGGDELDEALVDYVRGLKRRYTTALLSNALSNLRRFIEEEWRIDDAFHHIVISAEVGLMKPDPAIYEFTLEKMGFSPGEAVFIDDMADNVEAARRLGLHAIRFTSRKQAIQDLEHILSNHK